jgi:hypothetical protein
VAGEVAWAWLRQAGSDLSIGLLSYDPAEDATMCQAIAKHQQAVEKSVKAIVAGLNDLGIIRSSTGYSHDVEWLVSILVHLPHQAKNKHIQRMIRGLLNEHHRSEIKAICLLAPKKPDPGQLARRNTEYPYQNADGTWRAPVDEGSFVEKDVERYRQVAARIYEGSTRIVSALYRRGEP